MNRMIFNLKSKEELIKFNKLMAFLVSYNVCNFDYYNEIHVYQEEALSFIEWEQVPYSGQYGGKFVYKDIDHVVLKEVHFPDGHYEYLADDEEADAIDMWLDKNPGWVKTPFGTWTNEIENAKFEDYLKQSTIKLSDVIDTDIDQDSEKDE